MEEEQETKLTMSLQPVGEMEDLVEEQVVELFSQTIIHIHYKISIVHLQHKQKDMLLDKANKLLETLQVVVDILEAIVEIDILPTILEQVEEDLEISVIKNFSLTEILRK